MTVNKQESQPEREPGKSGGKKGAADKPGKSDARRVWIMRGLVTPFLGLLAVASIALGLLNATVWKPSREITATSTASGVQYIATDPGVLPLVDRQATLTVKSSSADNVCVALASGKDVNGWIAGSQYLRVTGLSSWTELATEKASAKGSAAKQNDGQSDGQDAVAFKDSDMWTKVSCNTGSVSLKTDVDGDSSTMALIDLGKSGDATISLTWERQTLPNFAMPFYFAGGLLAGMAVLTASLFAIPPHKRRKRVVASALAAAKAEEVSVSEAIAGSWRAIRPKPVSAERANRGRRRHASHRITDTGTILPVTDEPQNGPTIVDPSSRNLVAEAAQDNATVDAAAVSFTETSIDTPVVQPGSETHDAVPSSESTATDAAAADSSATQHDDGANDTDEAATSVITPEELQAYFARFTQESSAGAANDTNGAHDDAHDGEEAK